jgi:phage N-6-adenine-methyltransferase
MPKQKPGQSKQDYQTPPEFLAAVKNRLRIADFGLDIAASPENAVCSTFYTEEDNALDPRCVWACEGWSWLNPPYANIEDWVFKAASEARLGAYITMLVPASVGANWWRDFVNPYAYVSFLNGRLKFVGCKDYYPKDCALLLYTPWEFAGNEIWYWRNSVPQLRGESGISED